MNRDLDISPSIEARSLADYVVALAMHLVQAEDDGTGTYAEAARYDLTIIDAKLAKIRAAVDRMPKRRRVAA